MSKEPGWLISGTINLNPLLIEPIFTLLPGDRYNFL